ncbi:MAG TPA: PAS domain S-box protein [Gemmata sp.]
MPHTKPQPAPAQRPLADLVLDALDEGVLVVSRDGTIGFANRGAEVIFGYGPGELLGSALEALVPEGAQIGHPRHRLELSANPKGRLTCRRSSARGRRKDGIEFPVAVVLQPLPDGEVLTIVRDEAAVGAHPRDAEAALSLEMLGALEDRIAAVNGNGEIIATGAAWDEVARSAGCPPQRCGLGANYLDVCCQATGPGAEGAAEIGRGLSAVLHGTATQFTTEYPCSNGDETRWYRVLVKPLPGEPIRALVVHQDVTERRNAERVLAESERRFHDVVEAQTELICRFLPDGTLTFVNGAYCRYFGRGEGELLGRPLWDLVPEADWEVGKRHLAALTPERPVATLEHRVLGPDGAIGWQEWTDRAFFDAAGRVVDFQAVGRDITERKRAEDALRASKARFRDLFRNAPLATVCWRAAGADFVLTDCNEAALRLTGGHVGRALGRRLSELHADSPDHRANIARCYRERSAFECESHWTEVDWTGPAGPESDVLVSYSFVSPDLVMSSVQLITARKQQERVLRESEERHRQILSALHEGVILLDEQGRVLMCNERASELFDRSLEQLTGTRPGDELGDIRGADARPVPAEELPWEVTRRTGTARVGVALLTARDERPPVHLAVNAHALPAPQAPYCVVVSLTDVTAQWRAEEQLRQHQTELAHVARCVAIGEMAAVLAHELNQPLTAVVNYCRGSMYRLRDGASAVAEVAEGLDLAVAQAERAAGIIRRLREFMRKRAPHRSTTDLRDIVNEALALVGAELRHHQIEVALRLGTDLPPVQVDRIQIEQVLLNLLRNSAEALVGSPPAGRRITVETRRGEGGVLVEVADTGVGLAVGDLERVFEPFYTTKKEGTGLGLAISRSIVEAHGGRLFVRPGAEGGAVFGFTLPTESAPDRSATERANRPARRN